MFNISELHQASLIMDAAAIFLLIGTAVYTTIYRKRGRTIDRIYFALLVITVIMAISDGITYVLDGSTVPNSAVISLACNNIFFLTFELFCGLVIVYLDDSIHSDSEMALKRALIIMIPAIIMMVMILANNFGRFLYWVDPATSEYYQYPLYTLVFAGPILYAVWGLYYVIKIDVKVLWLYLLLIAVRVFFGNIMQGVSSTALIFSMGLVFIHIHYMRLPFYDEEEQ